MQHKIQSSAFNEIFHNVYHKIEKKSVKLPYHEVIIARKYNVHIHRIHFELI